MWGGGEAFPSKVRLVDISDRKLIELCSCLAAFYMCSNSQLIILLSEVKNKSVLFAD